MDIQRVPIVDLSPFFTQEGEGEGDGDDDDEKKAGIIKMIGEACKEYGFFQIVNHGVPYSLMGRALELSKAFFEDPLEEKLKYSPKGGGSSSPVPTGYNRKPEHMYEFSEFLVMLPPGSDSNIYPAHPPQFRQVFEEIFSHFWKTATIVESIINECLGLPPTLLNQYNNNRDWDSMVSLFYLPATHNAKIGVNAHKDVSCITFVLQDQVGGLEVDKDGEWIPLPPIDAALIVNIGDVLQVLTNDKLKSPSHRVVRPEGKSRSSLAFFYNLCGEKWVEPLDEFTKEIGEEPKYRGFLYKDYLQLRANNKRNPPSTHEDEIDISHYAITT